MAKATLERLKDEVAGQVIAATDADYDEARAVYNAMIDRHPQAVVRCRNVDDVRAAVNYARENDLDLAIAVVDTACRASERSTTASSSTCPACVRSPWTPGRARPGPRAARPGATSTTRPPRTAWPPPAGSSPPPGSEG
jgi:hypothetical protein